MKLDWIESKIGVLIILKTVQAIIISAAGRVFLRPREDLRRIEERLGVWHKQCEVDRIQTLSPARAIQLILFFPRVKLRNVRAETLLTACSQATNGRQLKLRVTQLKLPCIQGIDAWRVLLGIIHWPLLYLPHVPMYKRFNRFLYDLRRHFWSFYWLELF